MALKITQVLTITADMEKHLDQYDNKLTNVMLNQRQYGLMTMYGLLPILVRRLHSKKVPVIFYKLY